MVEQTAAATEEAKPIMVDSAAHRRNAARAQRDEEDLFMLLVFAESLGIPNPAAFYTMELLPIVYDRFHDWHVRMGMERSPLDHVSCC